MVFCNKELECKVLDTPRLSDHSSVMLMGDESATMKTLRGKVDIEVLKREIEATGPNMGGV